MSGFLPSTKSRTSRAITGVLVDLGLLAPGESARVVRLHPGRNQRSEGAWSWVAEKRANARWREICGSQWVAGTIIAAHRAPGRLVSFFRDDFGDVHLFPERAPRAPQPGGGDCHEP